MDQNTSRKESRATLKDGCEICDIDAALDSDPLLHKYGVKIGLII